MRIIAGSARGTRLGPVPAGTRPLSDRAREGLFSHLGATVAGARCLDLFGGTGAVGIEALSRGAETCVFVEKSPRAVRTIRDNLSKTGLSERSEVVRRDVGRYLEGDRDDRFDIVFADPPYRLGAAALRRIVAKAAERVESSGIMVLTRPAADDADVIPVHWALTKLLAYGDTHVLVCREGA
ncbi:MAG TPA: 16S rRNA (guanine(966)-N(2))-methyltransferase RsmD [Actinomycetota bacterium]|nr:16S rRNA (guanine(966)-N(2))-methyltransferase RsmD [Actinomycetota bacterium]